MKRLLTMLVILTGLIGSAGAVWADAKSDFKKGYDAYKTGDYAEAVKWYRQAAEQGHAKAQYNLGNRYVKGEGVVQDYAEAVKWYRQAAEQGHAKAQYNLGNRYLKGEGVVQDYAEAVKWYRKAAEQGHAKAQNNLGNRYLKGEGVTQDNAEAVKWYRKAAEQGRAIAQYNLGNRYLKGEGVTQDYAEAVKWYRKAAYQGHKRAQKKLENVAAETMAVNKIPLAAEMQKLLEKMQEKANAKCGSLNNMNGYDRDNLINNFIVTSITPGYNGWLSAQMTGQGYIESFYYNTKNHKSFCGSEKFRERGFVFIRK